MTWTYTPGSGTDRDRVRFWVGDTSPDGVEPPVDQQRVQNEEIADVLLELPEPKLAAAEICEALASKYAILADASVGDVRESFSQLSKAFEARADRLRRRGRLAAAPRFGGLSKSEKRVLDEDTDAVQPSFRIGMGDHPEVPSERDGSFDFGSGYDEGR